MRKIKATIVDLGMSNCGSVVSMLQRVGVETVLAEKPESAGDCDLLVLPGVGSFGEGMKRLRKSGWASKIIDIAEAKRSTILGLCLGMQLLTEGSEEGADPGLALIPGKFIRFTEFTEGERIKVPHMGWNEVEFTKGILKFVGTLPVGHRYYFVHSYYYTALSDTFVVGYTNYGVRLPSAVAREKVLGLQFHPEKSHRFGMSLLSEIAESARA